MRKLLLSFSLLLLAATVSQAQLITIAAARAMSNGSVVTVRGIVLNGAEFGAPTRYIYDGTGGLVIYGASVSSAQRGDSVQATGTVSPYNNLFELNPVSSMTVLNSGNPMPTPPVLSIPTGFAEGYEAHLVRFDNVTFTSSGTFVASTNYNITDGTNTQQIRINTGSNLVGTNIPGGTVSIVGVMSQYTTLYQLLPRDLNDFIYAGNPPIITTQLVQSNLATTSFTVSFNTQNQGNTILYYGTTPALGSMASAAAMTTTHSLNLTGLTPGTIYYVKGASVSATNDTSYSAITPMATISASTGKITVYFNNTVDTTVSHGTNAHYLTHTLDDTLIAYIGRAHHTLDIAIYNMDNNLGVVNALNTAFTNGVTVRIVADAGINSTAWSLLNAGIPKVLSSTGAAYGIMHNKFMIIDANDVNPNVPILWTGSANWTDQQLTQDFNNVIIFQDQSLARAYEIEFAEMLAGNFGPDKSNNTPHQFIIGGKPVQMYFSPSDNTEAAIKHTALQSSHDLEFIMYSYTRFSVSDSIKAAIQGGAFGAGIIDDTTSGTAAWNTLTSAMTPGNLILYTGSYLMHHKYMISDANAPASDPTVLTGSHNWTTAAQTKNDENTVIVHDADIANQYYQEWVARYHQLGGTALPSYAGIDDNMLKVEANVYPNPGSGLFNIGYATDAGGKVVFSITNLSGETIAVQSLTALPGFNHVTFELGSQPDGIYFVHIQNGNSYTTKKIVLNK